MFLFSRRRRQPQTRPPPPRSDRPPPYLFVGRYYRSSLRGVVIGFGVAAALWSLVWGIGSFNDIRNDKQFLPKFTNFDIALGSLYMGVFLIESFGVFASIRSAAPLVRLYAILSLVVWAIVTATEALRLAIHFMFKSDLINYCVQGNTGNAVIVTWGIWGDVASTTLTQPEAQSFCENNYNHNTFSDIAWLIFAMILSGLFASVVWSFYHQLLDPTRSRIRARGAHSEEFRLRPTGAGRFNPPPGPPPGQEFVPPYDPVKPPGYGVGPTDDTKEGKKGEEGEFV